MKQVLQISLILMTLLGCSESKKTDVNNLNAETENTQTDSLKLDAIDSKVIEKEITRNKETKHQPCAELIAFAIEIEELNWVSDTTRLRQAGMYPYLDREKMKVYERPFYSIEISEQTKEDLDAEVFNSVESAFGYFYRKEPKTSWNPDGVIEQWEFANEEQAEKALKVMEDVGRHLYINITPYFSRIRNYLFLFHTRNTTMSRQQKELFELFEKRNNHK